MIRNQPLEIMATPGGFHGERVLKLPASVVERALDEPITRELIASKIGFHPRAEGQNVCRPKGDVDYIFLHCISGTGWVDVGQGRLPITANTGTLLPPNRFHHSASSDEDPWSYYWLHFSGRMAEDYYQALSENPADPRFYFSLDTKELELFGDIFDAYREGFAPRMIVQASGVLHSLLSHIVRTHTASDIAQRTATENVNRVIEFMAKNVHLPISIGELASAAHMSHAHFCLLFRKITGSSPKEYFTRLKIQAACEILSTRGDKIELVARQVGIEDPCYFSRVFRKVMSASPAEYRKMQR